MNRSWKRALVLVALVLGGLAGCDQSPPVVDGCHALCQCRSFLDTERAACEQTCQMAAADPENTEAAGCLFCADEAETCSDFSRDCAARCAIVGSGLSGGNP